MNFCYIASAITYHRCLRTISDVPKNSIRVTWENTRRQISASISRKERFNRAWPRHVDVRYVVQTYCRVSTTVEGNEKLKKNSAVLLTGGAKHSMIFGNDAVLFSTQ